MVCEDEVSTIAKVRRSGATEVAAELITPSARVRLVDYVFSDRPEGVLQLSDTIRLDLCLTIRHHTARACFLDHWPRHRFERIGTLFAVPPAVIFHAKSDEVSTLTSVVCELALKPVLELFDHRPDSRDLSEERLMSCLDIRHMKVHGLMWRLAEEARHPGFAGEMLVESIAAQLAVELFRHETAIRERAIHGGLAPWQLRAIDERLREVGPAPTLTDLAALCQLSIRQLSRGFRSGRGSSIGAYVANSQMQHAAALLTTEQSVSSIAVILGFASTSNFCAAFQRATGMTPGQFRQTLLRR